MKKKLHYSLVFVLCCFAIISCKKSSSTTDPYSAPFANESVNTGKSNLSAAGQNLITQVDSMQSATGVGVIQSFTYFTSSITSLKSAAAFSTIFATESLVSGTATNAAFSSVLKSLSKDASNPQSIQDVFNAYLGTYTWNSSTQQWDSTGNSTEIVFNFPKTQDGTTNDAQLTITYKGVNGTSIIPDYAGDLPTSFDIAISVSNDKVFEYSFTASYDSNGDPNSVQTFVALYPFKIGVSWAYSNSTVSANYYFDNGTKTIIKFGGTINGNLDATTRDTATLTQNIISNANAYFQVFNIELIGKIDYKTLASDMDNADAITVDSLAAKAGVAALNKDASLVLIYADSNQKIAQAEAYVVTSQDYNYTYYNADIRFIFSDGSKGSLASYFGTGFSDLINDFNALVTNLNSKFGTSTN